MIKIITNVPFLFADNKEYLFSVKKSITNFKSGGEDYYHYHISITKVNKIKIGTKKHHILFNKILEITTGNGIEFFLKETETESKKLSRIRMEITIFLKEKLKVNQPNDLATFITANFDGFIGVSDEQKKTFTRINTINDIIK